MGRQHQVLGYLGVDSSAFGKPSHDRAESRQVGGVERDLHRIGGRLAQGAPELGEGVLMSAVVLCASEVAQVRVRTHRAGDHVAGQRLDVVRAQELEVRAVVEREVQQRLVELALGELLA